MSSELMERVHTAVRNYRVLMSHPPLVHLHVDDLKSLTEDDLAALSADGVAVTADDEQPRGTLSVGRGDRR